MTKNQDNDSLESEPVVDPAENGAMIDPRDLTGVPPAIPDVLRRPLVSEADEKDQRDD